MADMSGDDPAPGAAGWAAAGAVATAAGLVTVLVAAATLGPGMSGGAVLRWLAVTAIVLGLVRAWDHQRPRATRTRRNRVDGLVLLALAPVTAAALAETMARYATGFVHPAQPLTAFGGLTALGGLVLLRTRPRTPRVRLDAVVATMGVVLLVGATAGVVVATADDWTVRASTADTATPAAVPTSVTAVAWSTPLPAGTTIAEVQPGGAGALVRVDDGVLAIDGTDGHLRWSYRRLGTSAKPLQLSPDRKTVTFALLSGVGGRGERTVTLDALTGVVLASSDDPDAYQFAYRDRPRTDGPPPLWGLAYQPDHEGRPGRWVPIIIGPDLSANLPPDPADEVARTATEPVAACARAGLVLTDGVVCAYRDERTWAAEFRSTGTAPVRTARTGDQEISPVLPVQLGARVDGDLSRDVQFAAVPGAVIVYSRDPAADGAQTRIVGLR